MPVFKALVKGAKNFAENGIKNGADEVIKNGAKNGIKNGKPPARILNKADYATNTMPPTFPDGLDVEVFKFKVYT